MKKGQIIKLLVHIVAILGVILSFAENKSWFKDKNRAVFVEILKKDSECSKNHPGAQQFLQDFVCKNPKYSKSDFTVIDKVIMKGMRYGDKFGETNVSGVVKLKNHEGKVTEVICDYNELCDWAKEMPLWKWLSWWLVCLGVVFEIIIAIFKI
jgi:hypothetical protein